MRTTKFKPSEIGPIPADWEVRTIGELCEVQLGKMLDEEKNVGELKPYLGNRAVQWNRIVLENLPQVRLTEKDKQQYLLRAGDLLVCEGGEVGRAAIWHGELDECYYQKALHRLRVKQSDAITMEFMLQLFHFYGTSNVFDAVVTKTSIAHLPKDKLEMLPVACPPLPEQRRIAAVLSDADAWIESLEKLIEKKKLVKQGTMQALLSGKSRLPGFSGEWEEKRLGECMIVNPSNERQLPEKFFYIDLESVTKGQLSEVPVIPKANAPSRAQRLFQRGDILFQTVRPYQNNNLFIDFDASRYVASTGYAILRAKPGIDARLVFEIIRTSKFTNQVMDNCTGTGYPAINPSKLSEMSFPFPVSPAEQRAIAEVLSDMDAELAALSREKAKAEQIKQGMMQELLTGRTRLTGGE